MKKNFMLTLVLVLCLSVSLFAQEEESEMASHDEAEMAPPEPLDDAFCNKMLGEWEGWSESAMGKVEEWESNKMGLDGQFMLTEGSSTMEDGMTYKGTGGVTMDEEGNYVGFWMDSMRGMYQGHGKADGDKVTMEWKGAHGTYTRTIQMVNDNKYTATWKYVTADGHSNEGKMEMTRKKMTDKS